MIRCTQGDPSTGRCCCNCIHHYELHCHPCNQAFGRGSITDICGYICALPSENPLKPEVMYMDQEHGMCELHAFPSEFHKTP